MEAATDGARRVAVAPARAHATPPARKRLGGGSPQHDCLNMLRMEASLASFVRLLRRSHARAKAEPRPVLQIRSHYAGKVRSPVVLLFLWFVFQIRRVLMVRMSDQDSSDGL